MPLQRPRRIFRSAAIPAPPRGVGRVLATGILGGTALVLAGLLIASTDLFGHDTPQPRTLDADARAVAVIDGSTLRLRETVVGLLGIHAPDRGQTCHTPTGAGFDCGVAAANALADLVRERKVDCQLKGQDRMGRPLAICTAGGQDLNTTLVSQGWARTDNTLPELAVLESQARATHRGLWASDPGL